MGGIVLKDVLALVEILGEVIVDLSLRRAGMLRDIIVGKDLDLIKKMGKSVDFK